MAERPVVHSTKGAVGPTYYSALSRTIAATGQDGAQMRAMIYDFARVAMIQNNLYRGGAEPDWSGLQHQYRALENAIELIEVRYQRDAARLSSQTASVLEDATDASGAHIPAVLPASSLQTEILDPDAPIPSSFFTSHNWSSPTVFDRAERGYTDDQTHGRRGFWWAILLPAAAIFGIAVYVATGAANAPSGWMDFHRLHETQQQARNPPGEHSASPEQQPAQQTGIPGIPLPSTYGVYALSNGKLTELDTLPVRVPDPRVAISAPIATPSRVHLSNGQPQFIVFKREIVNNAPDKASLRVVARVARALTLDAKGRAKFVDVDGPWVVRSNSYVMKVAPMANNPEMIIIRPEKAEFVLPPGRYALLLQNLAYDFTLAGSNTDAAHCLERTDAVDAPVYSECRSP
jgi:hypothetical protein